MKIRELFADKSKWTRGAMARDKDGNRATPTSRCSTCWCMLGAIYKCYPDLKPGQRSRLGKKLDREAKKRGFAFACQLNDQGGYEAVIDLVNTLDI